MLTEKPGPRLVLVAALAATLVQGAPSASGAAPSDVTVIRYATLAPNGSGFVKVLKAWARTLERDTEGRVQVRFYSGGSQGDERDFVRKMHVGQMDAAGVTTVGLGAVVRPVLVLSAPGLIRRYDQLASVREMMNPRFDQLFLDAGFVLLAWSDAGKARIFSTQPVVQPSDIKSRRPWAWKDDPIFVEFLRVVGANPVRLGVPEVYPGLQTRMIDTVPSSAIGAVALQWHTRLKYVTKDNLNIVSGASVLAKRKFDELSPGDQKILVDTARRAARALDELVRRDDAKAYQTLLKRGIQETDTAAHRAAWDAAASQTRARLTGRVYSKSLLSMVENAAGTPSAEQGAQ